MAGGSGDSTLNDRTTRPSQERRVCSAADAIRIKKAIALFYGRKAGSGDVENRGEGEVMEPG